MILAHPEIPAARVGAVVSREWRVDINTVDHLDAGSGAWHWVLGDDNGPHWFATVEAVRTAGERQERLAAFEAAAHLSQRLAFVAAPVHTRDARVAVDIAPGMLLTVTPYLEGPALGNHEFEDDAERRLVAHMLGDLHQQPRPRGLPVWSPRVGWHANTQRADLERCLAQDDWTGGPWSGPASRLVVDSRPAIRQALRRFALLGAAVTGNIERWVVTHGRPYTGNLLHSADGLRLVDWGSLALAPRERDLRRVLGEAEGYEPWFAYLEAGGRPEPLSPDTVELFALQWHLSVIAENAVLFSRPHGDGEDERRSFGDLEREVGAILSRWA